MKIKLKGKSDDNECNITISYWISKKFKTDKDTDDELLISFKFITIEGKYNVVLSTFEKEIIQYDEEILYSDQDQYTIKIKEEEKICDKIKDANASNLFVHCPLAVHFDLTKFDVVATKIHENDIDIEKCELVFNEDNTAKLHCEYEGKSYDFYLSFMANKNDYATNILNNEGKSKYYPYGADMNVFPTKCSIYLYDTIRDYTDIKPQDNKYKTFNNVRRFVNCISWCVYFAKWLNYNGLKYNNENTLLFYKEDFIKVPNAIFNNIVYDDHYIYKMMSSDFLCKNTGKDKVNNYACIFKNLLYELNFSRYDNKYTFDTFCDELIDSIDKLVETIETNNLLGDGPLYELYKMLFNEKTIEYDLKRGYNIKFSESEISRFDWCFTIFIMMFYLASKFENIDFESFNHFNDLKSLVFQNNVDDDNEIIYTSYIDFSKIFDNVKKLPKM